MDRGYQHNFSRMVEGAMYNRTGRERKAQTIFAVLQDFLPVDTRSLTLLDIGASTGIIGNFLADHFLKVTGIDIDKEAIQYAKDSFIKDNLDFRVADAMDLDFKDNEFDIVVCTHIYEHVPDAVVLMQEIFRVLKPGGICYFAAGNRLCIMEPHYGLPFLSMVPRTLAHRYMKITGKGDHYHEEHLTLPGLKKLSGNFIIHDYTKKIIVNPKKFSAEYMLKPGSLKHSTAEFISQYIYWFCPTYIWILEKPHIKSSDPHHSVYNLVFF